MYPAPFNYHRAESVPDAVDMLSSLGEGARALAGGQSLLVWLKLRYDEPTDLVDLGRIPNLDGIEVDGSKARVGALATHARLLRSDLGTAVPVLGDCANGIADNQIRSRGTIGGSLAAGDPSCDWPPLLHTLDATIHCSGPDGDRQLDINGFVEDLYQTALKPGEIITGLEFDLPAAGSGGAYCSFKRCPAVYPTASVGVQMTLTDGDVVDTIRVAMGSVGLTPLRSQAAEAELHGHNLTDERIENAAAAAVATSEPVEDQRGSAEFKKRIISALFHRAVGIARRRCRGETVVNQPEYY